MPLAHAVQNQKRFTCKVPGALERLGMECIVHMRRRLHRQTCIDRHGQSQDRNCTHALTHTCTGPNQCRRARGGARFLRHRRPRVHHTRPVSARGRKLPGASPDQAAADGDGARLGIPLRGLEPPILGTKTRHHKDLTGLGGCRLSVLLS